MKFYRASSSVNGGTRTQHIIPEGEIQSLCGLIEGQTRIDGRIDGKLNKRCVVEIEDLSSKPLEKWCSRCKNKFREAEVQEA